MESFLPVERALLVASLIAQIFLVLRLVRERLVRRYPFFVAYLVLEVASSIVVMRLDFVSRAYAEAFRTYTFVSVVLRMAVAAELYERICQHFPGVGKFRFSLASVLVLVAAFVAALTIRPDLASQWVFPQTVIIVVERFQSEIFAGAFLFTWVFFRYVLNIEQPFRPNVLNHWRIATTYFAVTGVARLAILLSGGGNAVFPINSAMLAADIGCFVAWICLMRRAGEQLPWFQRLSPSEIEAAEQHHHDLLETVTSLPREISDRLTEN